MSRWVVVSRARPREERIFFSCVILSVVVVGMGWLGRIGENVLIRMAMCGGRAWAISQLLVGRISSQVGYNGQVPA
jgi:hypothetical protein